MADHGAAIIRPGTASDAASIHGMILAMAQEMGEPSRVSSSVDDLVRHGFSGKPRFHALIAERSGSPVGMCLYFPSFSSWRGTPGVYILDIYVTGSERGSGLAQQLIARTARDSAREGAAFLRLSVSRDNAAARRFYANMGIRHSEDECMYMAIGPAFEALQYLGSE